MKKYAAALLAALTLLMTGCAREAEETVPPTTVPATVPSTEPPVAELEIPVETAGDERPYLGTELDFWSPLAEEDAEAQVMLRAAEEFEARTGAVIRFTWQIEAASEAAEADIFQTSAEALGGISWAADLTELAAAADYEAHSFECLRQRVIDCGGALKGIPFTPRLEGLYYNREIFEQFGIREIPTDWESFLAACRKLADGKYVMTTNNEDAGKLLQMHLESVLGSEVSLEGLSKNEQAVQALQQLIDFVAVGYCTHASAPAGQNKMALSNGAMILGSNEFCGRIEDSVHMDIPWGVMGWPDGGLAYGDCDVLAIHSGCENIQAAFDFVMLLTTGEYDQLRADVTGKIPADPGNECAITGAVETLLTARAGKSGETAEELNALALQLWDGKFWTGAALAAAMENPG